MGLRRHRLSLAITACLALTTLGFVRFASSAARTATPTIEHADAIVVLTGGERRIEAGVRLLRAGFGKRLLISGVNRQTSSHELFARAGQLPSCCIDLGYDALDTIGNAEEARAWATRNDFATLIVVTSSYHMPRTLNEFVMAMPGTRLVAYPVQPRLLDRHGWWLEPPALRLLLTEYLKLVPSWARYAAHRMMESGHVLPARSAKL